MHDSLDSWLSALEKLHPKEIDLTLERITAVAERLRIQPTSFVITVAGTNGKGSCVAATESILLAAGYTVGAYFSPHLISFCERIRINGVEVSEPALCDAFTIIEQARGTISLTYFEFTTLAALWLFKQAKLDFLVLEIGLGGRLDAVNIIPADIAVISSISLDHTDWLGDTRELIGHEKAGIFRLNQTAICGDADIPNSILTKSHELNCSLSRINYEFGFNKTEQNWSFWGAQTLKNLPLPKIALQNAAIVLQIISLLPRSFIISESAICNGLVNINLRGRFQFIAREVPLILDVAHNPASAELLAENIKFLSGYKKVHALVGMLKDKDHFNSLKPLVPFIDQWWLTTLPGERGSTAEQLNNSLKQLTNAPANLFPQLKIAYDELMLSVEEGDCVVVFGSFLTVGAVLKGVSIDG